MRERATAERALPELTQIETVLGQNEMTWDDGLVFAGLEKPRRKFIEGLDELEATKAFVEDLDKLPQHTKQLIEWGAARGIAVARARRERFDAAVKTITAERAAAGDPPLRVAARRDHLTSSSGLSPGAELPTGRSPSWTKPQVIVGMARAVRLLNGKQLTQRTLKEIAEAKPSTGIPSWSSVDRCRRRYYPDETWRDWVTEATAMAKTPGAL